MSIFFDVLDFKKRNAYFANGPQLFNESARLVVSQLLNRMEVPHGRPRHKGGNEYGSRRAAQKGPSDLLPLSLDSTFSM